jgi:hypothetical protein
MTSGCHGIGAPLPGATALAEGQAVLRPPCQYGTACRCAAKPWHPDPNAPYAPVTFFRTQVQKASPRFS